MQYKPDMTGHTSKKTISQITITFFSSSHLCVFLLFCFCLLLLLYSTNKLDVTSKVKQIYELKCRIF